MTLLNKEEKYSDSRKKEKQKDLFISQMFATAITKTQEWLINMTGWMGNIQLVFEGRSGNLPLFAGIIDMTIVNA